MSTEVQLWDAWYANTTQTLIYVVYLLPYETGIVFVMLLYMQTMSQEDKIVH